MLVIRPVRLSDLDDLYRLSQLAGSGMTSLPSDLDTLQANIENAVASFNRAETLASDYFLLVMEDTDKGLVVGTSAVHARTGSRQAFYAYRLMSVTHFSHSLDKQYRSGLLHLSNEYSDCSEVGTLFLDPAYRGNGHWLSRARYLLIAQHPERFASHVIAELRGYLNPDGTSPVWNAIGQHFFHMSYDEADRLCGLGSNQFITELMPKYPIYTNLLPQSAIEALGKPHRQTKRAMQLLLDEGFVYENLIDIFDGGPLVRCQTDKILSVQQVERHNINIALAESREGEVMLLANPSLAGFRLVNQTAVRDEQGIGIDARSAAALELSDGDNILSLASQDKAPRQMQTGVKS